MKALKDYIRSEWLIWVGTFVFLFALSALNAALASGISSRISDEVILVQDNDSGWLAGHQSNWVSIGEYADTLRPMWRGKINNRPAVLVAARNNGLPSVSYRLIVVSPDGLVKVSRPVVRAKNQSFLVDPGYPIARIFFNNEVQVFNFEKD